MKLEFNKNFEYNLVNRYGFKLCTIQSPNKKSYYLRNFVVKVWIEKKSIELYFFQFDQQMIKLYGCKTIHDLYRLEKLIEGNTNQK